MLRLRASRLLLSRAGRRALSTPAAAAAAAAASPPTTGRAFRAQPFVDVPLLERPQPLGAAFDASSLFTASPVGAQSAADVGRYFEYSVDEIGRYMPEGFPAGVQREFAATNTPALMVRTAALGARALLDELAADDAALAATSALLLTGARGVGKSTTLSYLVHAARARGWLVLHVPSAHGYLNCQHRFAKLANLRIEIGIAQGGEAGGAALEQLHDVPAATRALLRALIAAHDDALAELPCRTEATGAFGRALNLKFGALADLAQLGANDADLATHALLALLRELRLVTERPVMIAIDDVNAFERTTAFRDAATTFPLHASQFLLPHLLPSAAAAGAGLARGLVVCAESASLSFHARDTPRRTKRRLQSARAPWALPSAAGVRCVEVPSFDAAELTQALRWYGHAGAWRPADGKGIGADGAAAAAARQVHMLTASRGEAVRKLCTQLA